jgi:hypothetical protein
MAPRGLIRSHPRPLGDFGRGKGEGRDRLQSSALGNASGVTRKGVCLRDKTGALPKKLDKTFRIVRAVGSAAEESSA